MFFHYLVIENRIHATIFQQGMQPILREHQTPRAASHPYSRLVVVHRWYSSVNQQMWSLWWAGEAHLYYQVMDSDSELLVETEEENHESVRIIRNKTIDRYISKQSKWWYRW